MLLLIYGIRASEIVVIGVILMFNFDPYLLPKFVDAKLHILFNISKFFVFFCFYCAVMAPFFRCMA